MRAIGLLLALADDSSMALVVDGASVGAQEAVLQAARAVDHDCDAVMGWYHSDAIVELGGLTAEQLVARGEGRRVLELLRAIRMGERDDHF
jgi:hypothetical protein